MTSTGISAPGLSGEADIAEHVPLPFDAYPTLAQQGVASPVYPWSAAVLVVVTFPNGQPYHGAGVMVGRNDVLTAAHMVYEPAWGGLASSVTVVPAFVPGRGLDGPYGSSPAFVTAADLSFGHGSDGRILFGDRGPTGWMGLDPAFAEGYANLSGYPGAYGLRLTNDVAWAFGDALDQVINLYWFEAHPGNSGGPVWHYGPDGNPAVVGLVSSGFNGRGGAAFEVATSCESILGWIASNDYLLAWCRRPAALVPPRPRVPACGGP